MPANLIPILSHQQTKTVKYTHLRERDMGKVEGMYLKDACEKYGPGFRNLGKRKMHYKLKKNGMKLSSIMF